MISLGDLVRDEVTGFEGVVLARMECLYEATQVRIHPRALREDVGEPKASFWMEEDRCVVIEQQAVVGFRTVAGHVEV